MSNTTFHDWPDLLPEMQGEVRSRLDVLARFRLRQACRAMYKADANFVLPDALATRLKNRYLTGPDREPYYREFCVAWMETYGTPIFTWLKNLVPAPIGTRDWEYPRQAAWCDWYIGGTIECNRRVMLYVKYVSADDLERKLEIEYGRTTHSTRSHWEILNHPIPPADGCGLFGTYSSLEALLADKGDRLVCIKHSSS